MMNQSVSTLNKHKKIKVQFRNFVMSPVFKLFQTSPRAFSLFYKSVDFIFDKRMSPGNENLSDEKGQIVSALRKNGIYLAKGIFSKELIQQAKSYFDREFDHFDINDHQRFEIELKDEIHAAQTIKTKVLMDRKTKNVFTGFDSYQIHGRRRIRHYDFRNQPSIIHQLHSHSLLIDLLSTYYHNPVYVKEIMMERMTPGSSHEPWHFDRTRDQFKVMNPLTSIKLENGPMTYIQSSHIFSDVLAESYSGSFCVSGEKPYLVSKRLADLSGEHFLCTAELGDGVLFDTLGVHTGSLCQVGHRDVIVVCFEVKSPKNKLFTMMGLKN